MAVRWIISILTSLGCQMAAGETFATQMLPKIRMQLVDQNQSDCGPASFFNSLLFNRDLISVARAKLAGPEDWQRYRSFLRELGSRASSHYNDGRPRLTERGIEIDDLEQMANDLFAGTAIAFAGLSGLAGPGENQGGALLRREFSDWRDSLARGFAPVVFIGVRDPNGRNLDAHAYLLLDATGSEILIYDSRTFQTSRVYLAEGAWGRARVEAPGLRPSESVTGPLTINSYLILRRSP